MSARCQDPIPIVASNSCPSNCSDNASARCHFSNTMVYLAYVDVTRIINSNSSRIIQLGARRQNPISIVKIKTCPSDCSDYASARCHFSDTTILSIGDVDIARSINIKTIGIIYLSARRQDPISVVAKSSCPSNCSDNASAHCHFSNTLIYTVGEVGITRYINLDTKRELCLSARRRDPISIVAIIT